MWLRAALITVLQLTTLLIGGTTPDTDFAIKEFQDHPGIYFENLGDLQIYRDSWKLILHLDISYIYRRESNLQAALYDILAQCKTPSTNNLQKFCKTFGTKIQSKVDRVTKFLTYVQQTISSAPKQRRGLIDGLGYIGKSLFGLMDSEDRKIINDQIGFLKRQDSRLKNTIKGQMQIVRANAELLNETIHNVQENEKTLLNATWQIQYLLQQTTDITRFRETIDENLILINSVAETLLRDTQDLLEFIMDIKKGVLNPQLMPPAQIITYLTSALAHIPQGLDFPIGIKLENMHVLYDILTLSAFSDTKSITVVLDIPLLSAKKFKLSKVHPVPTKVNDSFYAYIEPLDSYVVLDTSVQDYIQLSKEDLTECKTINELYLCTSNHPMFKAIPYGPCEVQLYTKLTQKPNNCKIRIMTLKHTILIELQQPGTWIYIAPKQIQLAVTCGDKNTNMYSIKDSGIITIRNKCTITTAEFTIETGKQYGIEKTWNYLPGYNLTLDEITFPQTTVNSYRHTNFELKRIIKHPEELNKVSKKLEDLQNDLEKPEIIPTEYHYSFFTLSSVTGFITTTLCMFAIYKCIVRCKAKTPRHCTTDNTSRDKTTQKPEAIIKIVSKEETSSTNSL
ncbi:uncharacterized protein LOC143378125 [Andrena cerasifolii]|uniref:uncharacterized protein LOC143371632 n=1 Tax=Andrena cerasifolii TaxID=2819439 RepID=UPI00403844C2